jgi:iron complex outermembrane receptor protein
LALLCGCAAVPALAQADAPPAAPSTTLSASPGGDIIVTAQRQNQKLRDVPISITALDHDTLIKSGVTTTADLSRITPGFNLPQYGFIPQPSIRGISSNATGLGNASNVAIYVDGVYHTTAGSQMMNLPDVSQIEVLKGPQGTFYGANSEGGAIIIHTLDPQFKLQGMASASYGNFNDKEFRGYITGPLSDTVAVSLAGGYEGKDGFRHDILRGGQAPGIKSSVIRGKILWKPTSNFSATAIGYWTKRFDGDEFSSSSVGGSIHEYNGTPLPNFVPLGVALANAYHVPIPIGHGPNQATESTLSEGTFETYGGSLLLKWDSGIGTFDTVTSYDHTFQHGPDDIGQTAVNIGVEHEKVLSKSFVQELNFVSHKFSGFQVTAGLFMLRESDNYQPQIFTGYTYVPGFCPVIPLTVFPTPGTACYTFGDRGWQKKRSYSAYLQVSYDVTPKLVISAGGRYIKERELQAASVNGFDNPSLLPIYVDPSGWQTTGSKAIANASIRYALNPTSNVYFSFSQGYKSGLESLPNIFNGSPPPVKPESLNAYEIGYKGRVAPGLNIELSAFHYDWTNIQVFAYIPPSGIFQNAAKARVNGLEFDATWKASHDFTVSGGFTYLDGKYLSFKKAGVYLTDPYGYGNDFDSVDASGHQLQRMAKYQGNLNLSYTHDFSSGELGAYLSIAYNSRTTFDPIGNIVQGPVTTLNGELSFAPEFLKGLRLVLWGKNLTNKAYIVGVLATNYNNSATYAAPRQFGGRVEFKF